MDRIRLINNYDYNELEAFYCKMDKQVDPVEIYPPNSTYIFERNNKILYAVSLWFVNGLKTVFAEGLIKNPEMDSDFKALEKLQKHIELEAKNLGYEILIGASDNQKLANHFEKLGYNKSHTIFWNMKGL